MLGFFDIGQISNALKRYIGEHALIDSNHSATPSLALLHAAGDSLPTSPCAHGNHGLVPAGCVLY